MKYNLSYPNWDKILLDAPVGIITVDPDLTITTANHTLLQFELAGFNSSEKFPGTKLTDIPLFNSPEISDYLNELKEGVPFETKLFNKLTLDGNEITIVLKAVPQMDGKIFEGAIFILEDFKVPISLTPEKILENDLFNKFINSISDYFLIANKNGKVIYSPKLSTDNLFENNYETVEQIFDGKHAEIISKLFNNAVKTKRPVFSQNLSYNENSSLYIQLSFIPITNKFQNVNYIVVLVEDITETYSNIINLENEAKELRTYQSIASTVLDAIIATDEKGSITFWNNAATKVFGVSKIETFGKFIGNVIKDFYPEYFENIIANLKSSNNFETKIQYKLKNTARTISLKMALTEEIDEERSVVILCSDITDRENLEKTLRNSEETFRSIVTNIKEYICTFTLEGKITYANPYFTSELGYTENDLKDKEIAELIDFGDIDNGFDIASIKDEKTEPVRVSLIKNNGEKVFVLANFAAVSDFQGNPKYYIAVLIDISEKTKNEHELNIIKSIFETASQGIILVQNRKIILANNAYITLFGYNNINDVLEQNPLDFISENDREKAKAECSSINIGEELSATYHAKRTDGEIITIQRKIKKFLSDKSEYIVHSYVDITEQQKAKAALEEAEARYKGITENIDDVIWIAEFKEKRLRQLFVAPSVMEITKYTDKELMENPRLWIKMIHPDDKKNVVSKLRRVFKDVVRKQVELEYRILDKYGSLIWIQSKFNFVRDEFGNVEKIFGLSSDITLNKRNEEEYRKTTEELKKLNDSKDRFISIISHDLRTPFSSILGFTDLLLNETDTDPEKQKQYIEYIHESANNMLKLVNSILDWTRLQTGRIEYVAERIDARTIIDNSIQMLSGTALQKGIKLYSTLEHEMYVHGDRNLLLQVFNNLIANAIKFTNSGGEIFISAEPLIDKRVIQFSVNDTGIGIADENLDKLFSVDSKFTTEGTKGEKGSGLGLSLVKEIIQKHGGEISVSSEVGTGSSFLFTIPISSNKILLVDDVPSDAILYKKLLNNIIPNYEVEIVSDGSEGMEVLEKSMPALIITDHIMPKMSGFDFVKNIMHSELKYKPPIIVLSSDITPDIAKEYEELGIEYVFKKPVDLTLFKNALVKSLQKALIT